MKLRHLSNLPTLADMQRKRRAEQKTSIRTRKQIKGRKDRAEGKQKKDVRAECERRDGPCRFAAARPGDVRPAGALDPCDGPTEWAHMHARRRSKTRNQPPEVRHDTRFSFMACKKHHDQYDGKKKPTLTATQLTRHGADGPLKFGRAAA